MRHSDMSGYDVETGIDPAMRSEGVCSHHSELLSLARETKIMAKDTMSMVSKINTRLMGDMSDMNTHGLIVDIAEIKKFQSEYSEAKALDKIKDVDKKFAAITRIIYWLCGIIGVGTIGYITDFFGQLSKLVQK